MPRLCLALLLLLLPIGAHAQALTGNRALDLAAATMRPGEYRLDTDRAMPGFASTQPGGVEIAVSLAMQRLYVYRQGELIAVATVSTGKAGKRTPTGGFTILQKRQWHRSNIYSNAPMPFMQRLTWTGIAIHAGQLPGYPASHGCIRLPYEFARRLFGLTGMGDSVTVADWPPHAPVWLEVGWTSLGFASAPARSPPRHLEGEQRLDYDMRVLLIFPTS